MCELKGHQNNPQTPWNLLRWDVTVPPGLEIPGSATVNSDITIRSTRSYQSMFTMFSCNFNVNTWFSSGYHFFLSFSNLPFLSGMLSIASKSNLKSQALTKVSTFERDLLDNRSKHHLFRMIFNTSSLKMRMPSLSIKWGDHSCVLDGISISEGFGESVVDFSWLVPDIFISFYSNFNFGEVVAAIIHLVYRFQYNSLPGQFVLGPGHEQ